MKKVFLIPLLIMTTIKGFTQYNPPNPSSPSSNIGKESLEIADDLYNGRVNISIPVLKYSFEGIDFPISLNYSGNNGLKTDELPSWVGAGWNLQAGGYITRTVRGKPDEIRDFETILWSAYDKNTPGWSNDKKETVLNTTDFSYFTNCNKLTDPNWSTSTYAGTFLHSNEPLVDNSNPLYGKKLYNTSPLYDLVPDQFSFSMGGISGKFYLNQSNEWIVESNNGKNYSVHVEMGELVTADYFTQTNFHIYEKVPNLIKYITLTSPDGIKYFFGNENVNAPFSEQYFDFSHSSTLRPIPDRYIEDYTNGNDAATLIELVPNTWHLTKVENLKTHSIITLSYKESFQFSTTNQAYGKGGSDIYGSFVYRNDQSQIDPNSQFLEPLSPISRVLTRTWSLTSINFPNGVTIKFESTPSSQLSTDKPINDYDSWFMTYSDIFNYSNAHGYNTLLQLNKIILAFNNLTKKEIHLNYTLSSSQRLQLQSFGTYNNDISIGNYSFKYNSDVSLPEYGVGKDDHWGFFNNKNFFASVSPDDGTDRYTYSAISNYNNYRAPDANYSIAEILTQITYPEGGRVEFGYEPNFYSKKQTSDFDYSITDVGSNLIGGGVRIRDISYYTSDNKKTKTKSFEYLIPESAGLSSGVMSGLPPRYLYGNSESFLFQASGYDPIYYRGNAITYTYVSEIENGNGKKIFEFNNFDNGYADNGPIASSVPDESVYKFPCAFQNNKFKRGKIKSEKITNENGDFLKVIQYHYEDDNESNKKELRSLYLDGYTTNFASVSDKIYSDNLISEEEIDYTPNGNIDSKSETSYDAYGNIKSSKIYDSKGRVFRRKYQYAYEYSVGGIDDISLGIENLKTNEINNAVVETVDYDENQDGSDSKVIAASINTYKAQSPFIDKIYRLELATPIPVASFEESSISANGNFTMDSKYSIEPDKIFDSYDSKGNLLEMHGRNGIKKSYIWDYNNSYQIAEVINADKDDISYTSFETDGNDSWVFDASGIQNLYSITGKQSYNLSAGVVTSFSLIASKSYILSYWYRTGSNISIGWGSHSNSKTGPTINDWTYAQLETTGSNQIDILGTGYIDEIRLYPKGAEMTTATYDPLIGITSHCDMNNRITYYDYDPFGRLYTIRNQDNKIIKKYCYNLAGQPSQCNLYLSAAIDEDFYSQNCTPGEQSALPYHVKVSDGKFMSYVDQQTADLMAEEYAQDQANQFGSCQINNISINGDDEIGTDFSVSLHNVSTGQNYSLSLSAHNTATLEDVPPGNYDISLTPNSSTGWFNYSVGCGYYDNGSGGSTFTFYSIPLSYSCNTITID